MPRSAAHLPKPKKGTRHPGAGRKKGTPNKITKVMKDAVMGAFNDIGGQAALARFAKKPGNQRTFFSICAKLIPSEITGAGGKDLIPNNVKVNFYLPDNGRKANPK